MSRISHVCHFSVEAFIVDIKLQNDSFPSATLQRNDIVIVPWSEVVAKVDTPVDLQKTFCMRKTDKQTETPLLCEATMILELFIRVA